MDKDIAKKQNEYKLEAAAHKVMMLKRYDNAVAYRAACDCGSEEHDCTFWTEYDKEIDMLIMNMWKKVHWDNRAYCTDSILDKPRLIWERLKCAARILFLGHIDFEEDFLFYDEDHMTDFINMLTESRDFVIYCRDLEKAKEKKK